LKMQTTQEQRGKERKYCSRELDKRWNFNLSLDNTKIILWRIKKGGFSVSYATFDAITKLNQEEIVGTGGWMPAKSSCSYYTSFRQTSPPTERNYSLYMALKFDSQIWGEVNSILWWYSRLSEAGAWLNGRH
jgi:hypothetical protein